jgi:hypothetical protein
MRLDGDTRALAQEGARLDVWALYIKRPNLRTYLAGVMRSRWGTSQIWCHDLVDRASWSEVDRKPWSGVDLTKDLQRGTLRLDGDPVWSVPDERPGLVWSLPWRWAALSVWEDWARQHKPENWHLPRMAVEALCAHLKGDVTRDTWRSVHKRAWESTFEYASWSGAVNAAQVALVKPAPRAVWGCTMLTDSLDGLRGTERLRRGWTAYALWCATQEAP